MDQLKDCAWFTCWVPPPPSPSNEIFGFGEFVGAIALLIVFFQIVEFRYRFRLAILPAFFMRTLLALIAFIGLGTLTMELWLREGWSTPRSPITPGLWEAIFALLFLGSFVAVTYFTFIRPPVFRRRNAKRFARALYRVIVKGDDAELAVAADELRRSSRSLVSLCATREERQKGGDSPESIAYDIFRLIANRKFCRHVVASAQSTAIALCQDITKLRRYEVPIGPFCTAVTLEAIENKDSILYHETQDFASDLIGNIKPWTSTIYGDYALIRSMGYQSPLEIRVWSSSELRWDVEKWVAFARVVLAILRGYGTSDFRGEHHDLGHAIENIHWLTSGIGDAETDRGFYDSESYRKLRLAVDFVKDATEVLEEAPKPVYGTLKSRDEHPSDVFHYLAELMFEILMDACQVKGSRELMWTVQHNTAWSGIFGLHKDSRALKIVRTRVIRKLYEQIVEMDKYSANYRGIKVVGLVLNVLGLKTLTRQQGHLLACERSIHRFAMRWARRNFLKLRREYPDVAEAMLIGSLDFEEETRRLRKTYASWLGKAGDREYLDLDEPAAVEQP